jgi:hypothetical protein
MRLPPVNKYGDFDHVVARHPTDAATRYLLAVSRYPVIVWALGVGPPHASPPRASLPTFDEAAACQQLSMFDILFNCINLSFLASTRSAQVDLNRTHRCRPCQAAWLSCSYVDNIEVMDHLASWQGGY